MSIERKPGSIELVVAWWYLITIRVDKLGLISSDFCYDAVAALRVNRPPVSIHGAGYDCCVVLHVMCWNPYLVI